MRISDWSSDVCSSDLNDDVVGLNAGLTPAAPARQADPAQIRRQRIVRTRRQYNQWVNNDTLEDYALRFTAQKARRWSAWWVANCALGSIAFLACEAIGATVTLSYGFDNTAIALLRSEEHTSELQYLMRISYAVFCSKKKQ